MHVRTCVYGPTPLHGDSDIQSERINVYYQETNGT